MTDVYAQRTPSLTASDETSASSDGASLRTNSRERPLPRLPVNDKKMQPKATLSPKQYATVDNRRSSQTLSSLLLPSLPSSLIDTLRQPRILSCFLTHTSWRDFNALTCTSRQLRWTLFRQPELKDVVFSNYVPGYRFCLRHADLDRHREMKVTLRDLNFFMMSQSIPLHQYPMHALSLLSALLPTPEQDDLTNKYVAATLAHSRFVLLLQSLIHSAVLPRSPESEDGRLSLSSMQTGVKELVFPAPLSYFGLKGRDGSLDARSASSGARSSSQSSARTTRSVSSLFNLTTRVTGRSSSAMKMHERSTSTMRKNRMSIFGGKPQAPLPPPAEEPVALRFYSGGWRRAFRNQGYISEDEGESAALKRPHRRFASVGLSSSDSSLSSPTSSPSPRLLERESSEPGSFMGGSRSPHDIQLATSRSRAPILRVFVPCSRLSEASIRACEDLLLDAGLWDHLSSGDIVCNLGYVPEDQDQDRDGQADWLMFNGYSLVLFRPPAPPPIENPLTLPSPLYYAHILPLFVDPTYVLTLPSPTSPPQMTLAYMRTSVPSKRSPTGRVPVKKYMWLAVLKAQLRPGLGEGWQGEWVLEGEGTKEGKQSLLDAIRGDETGEREWEVVREKSHGGRIWLKLLTPVGPHPQPSLANTLMHTPRTQSHY
ncbi:hypothetical protein GLOTRDRAFT_139664 [Gloeophyllum trabeum ATCC 11539]|uniref:Uncharacterized protein n=1 Tax=Gloeophyllum trabeum (strain ATCC 11539 / FP-39264 / Madison 617) TaxID=670483 RepID=S7Q4G0_GLOTA|nr:uncharacterized protein GLOTRDRAFT_139664 [Gloeophyllum trabeum ATCC 11539]EPQ54368.1 hypothetical protein GLOTRDRAFT_139664 [Gloeophyllum trabeum ATCC 11539]